MKIHSNTCIPIPLLGAALIFGAARLAAQPSSESLSHFWRTDGPVNAIVVTNRIAYLGGDFTYVGPASGAAGLLDADFGDPLPGFPKIDGTINTIIPDGAGGWYVGGNFKPAANDRLQHLIHVLPGNVVDPNFKPNPDQPVRTLLLSGRTLLAGGDFSQIENVPTGGFALLDPATGKTNGIRLRVNGVVAAMAASPDAVYLGGAFNSIVSFNGNQQVSNVRQRLAAINPDTGEVLPWNPGSTGGQGVNAIALGPNGVYVGGEFNQCGGKPRNAIALLNTSDGVAANWNPNAQTAGGGTVSVSALALVGNVVYVGGDFTTIGARSRTRIAALAAGGFGQADANWQADANDTVNFIIPFGADLLVGGAFTAIGGKIETVNFQQVQTGGTARRGFARLAQANAAVSDWGPQVSLLRPTASFGAKAVANALAMQGPVMLLGGNFISFGGVNRARLAAIDLATGAATAWNPGADLAVRALALGRDGLYVGGSFTNVGGASRPRVARLKYDSGQATDWDARFSQGQFVNAIAVGKNNVYVGGQFNKIGGKDRSSLAEIDATTGDATEWNPSPSGQIFTLLFQNDQVYVGGQYNGLSGNFQVQNLALLTLRVDPKQQLVSAFNPQPDGNVRTMLFDGGRLFVGGDFTKISGQDRSRVAAIDPATGKENDPWDAQLTGRGQIQVRALLPVGQAVYLGGQFSGAGGENRARIASVHPLFGASSGWDPGADLPINAIARSDDLILIGGEFTRLRLRGPNADQGVGAQPVPYFAAFNSLPAIVDFKKNAAGKYSFGITDGDGLGTTLQIQAGDALNAASWQTVKSLDVLGIQDPFEEAAPAPGGTRFYRLVRQP